MASALLIGGLAVLAVIIIIFCLINKPTTGYGEYGGYGDMSRFPPYPSHSGPVLSSGPMSGQEAWTADAVRGPETSGPGSSGGFSGPRRRTPPRLDSATPQGRSSQIDGQTAPPEDTVPPTQTGGDRVSSSTAPTTSSTQSSAKRPDSGTGTTADGFGEATGGSRPAPMLASRILEGHGVVAATTLRTTTPYQYYTTAPSRGAPLPVPPDDLKIHFSFVNIAADLSHSYLPLPRVPVAFTEAPAFLRGNSDEIEPVPVPGSDDRHPFYNGILVRLRPWERSAYLALVVNLTVYYDKADVNFAEAVGQVLYEPLEVKEDPSAPPSAPVYPEIIGQLSNDTNAEPLQRLLLGYAAFRVTRSGILRLYMGSDDSTPRSYATLVTMSSFSVSKIPADPVIECRRILKGCCSRCGMFECQCVVRERHRALAPP